MVNLNFLLTTPPHPHYDERGRDASMGYRTSYMLSRRLDSIVCGGRVGQMGWDGMRATRIRRGVDASCRRVGR